MRRSRYLLPLGRFALVSAILSTAVWLGVVSHSTPDVTPVIALERVAEAVEEAAPAIAGFDHLGEQAVDFEKATARAEADVTERPSGVVIHTPAETGGIQPILRPRFTRLSFDAVKGIAAFDIDGVGTVRVTRLERGSIERSEQDGHVSIVDLGTERDKTEVTIASAQELEQHVVVEPAPATETGNEIVLKYRIDAPHGARLRHGSSGKLWLVYDGIPVMEIRADEAVDEAGAVHPVGVRLGEDPLEFDAVFEPAGRDITGDLAIDPAFASGSDVGEYYVRVCNVVQFHECEATPIAGATPLLPLRFGLSDGGGRFEGYSSQEDGLVLRTKTGRSFALDRTGALTYSTIDGVGIRAVAFDGLIRDSDGVGGFSCGAALYTQDGDNFIEAQTSGNYSVGAGQLSKEISALVEMPGNSVAAAAGMWLRKTHGATFTAGDTPSTQPQCWMPKTQESHTPNLSADRFVVRLRELAPPVVNVSSTLGQGDPSRIQLISPSNVSGSGASATVDSAGYLNTGWHRAGDEVQVPLAATDQHSGVARLSAHAKGSILLGGYEFTCSDPQHGLERPCSTDSGTRFVTATLTAGNSDQGMSWYRPLARDFAGNDSSTSASLHYLFDSVKPIAPVLAGGATTAATAPVIDVAEFTDEVAVSWSGAADPGASETHRTGSGIKRVDGEVTVDGTTRSFTGIDNPPNTPGSPTGTEVLSAVQGVNAVRFRAIDHAGNTSEIGDHRYIYIDTTSPEIHLAKPASASNTSIRRWSAIPLAFTVTEESSSDTIDMVGVRYRMRNSDDDWTEEPIVSNQTSVVSVDDPTLTGMPSGEVELQALAVDGGGSQVSHSGSFTMCADTSILDSEWAERPQDVRHRTFAGATRIRFDVHSSATKVKAWIVERRDADTGWLVAGRVARGELSSIDETFQGGGADVRWRITPVTLNCTDRGDATLGEESRNDESLEDPDAIPAARANLLGREPYWTMQQFDLGTGTSAGVNAATGNVLIERELLHEPGVGLSTNVTIAYNSQQIGNDNRVAKDGIVGSNVTLGISGALSLYEGNTDELIVLDTDGTRHSFTDPSNGLYTSPTGVVMSVRRITPDRIAKNDGANGFAGAEIKVTSADGVTSYFARDGNSVWYDVIARTDRSGNTLRYRYECVAVTDDAELGTRVWPLTYSPGSWQLRVGDQPHLSTTCPDAGGLTVLADPDLHTRVHRRLVEVADPRITQDARRVVTLSYAPNTGHLIKVTGHTDADETQHASLTYIAGSRFVTSSSLATPEKKLLPVRLETVTQGAQRGVTTWTYDAPFQDPGSWFDADVLVGSVRDARGNTSRFSYRVPDLGRPGSAAPRAVLYRNRIDTTKSDGIGVEFSYLVDLAGTLTGTTRITDQQGRVSSYRWFTADDTFGQVHSTTNPTGMVESTTWASRYPTTITRAAGVVRREPVLLVGTHPTRLANGAFVDGSLTVEAAVGRGFEPRPTSLYTIDYARGTVARKTLSKGQDQTTQVALLVTYQPKLANVTDTLNYDEHSGLLEATTTEQTRDPELRSEEWIDPAAHTVHAQRQTNGVTHRAAPVFPDDVGRTIRDVMSVRTGDRTTSLKLDAAGNILERVAPSAVQGQSATTCQSYYSDGLLRSETDELGITVAYWDYTLDGEARRESRPLQLGVPCSQVLNGLTDAEVARKKFPVAFATSYDDQARVTCVRDLRGGTDSATSNRFESFQYDSSGRLIKETSPFRTTASVRIRRLTTHAYDANGNLVRTIRNQTYSIAKGSSSDADCGAGWDGARGGTSLPRGEHDSEYDPLDRVVISRLLPNWDEHEDGRATRTSETRYSRAGDLMMYIEPRGRATADGGDYTTTYQYDHAGRLLGSRDGIGRYTCQREDQFGRITLSTSPELQQDLDCTQLKSAHAERSAYDQAGHVIWHRSVGGQRTLNAYDQYGQLIRSSSIERERSLSETRLGGARVQHTAYQYTDTGLEKLRTLPARNACLDGRCSGMKYGAPSIATTYDPRGNVVARVDARGNTTRYAYDLHGRLIREQSPAHRQFGLAEEASAYVHTSYDAFDNPVAVSGSMRADSIDAARQQTKQWTQFTYFDDDAPATKDDARHDVRVAYKYDAAGNMVERVEGAIHAPAQTNRWRSVQRYSWYRDGSARTSPYPVHKIDRSMPYARDTCIGRGIRSDKDMPRTVYRLNGTSAVFRLGDKVPWTGLEIGGKPYRAGEAKVTRHLSNGGVMHSYDENGQLRRIRGCGTSVAWLRRDGIGNVLEGRTNRDEPHEYRYDAGGRLIERRSGEQRLTLSYHDPDFDLDSADPGAGLVASERLGVPSHDQQWMGARYRYTLGGLVDRVDRLQHASTRGDTNDRVVSRTHHTYNHASELMGSKTDQRTPKGTFITVLEERLHRDVASNVLLLEEQVRVEPSSLRDRRKAARQRAKKRANKGKKLVLPPAVVRRTNQYQYDSLGRVAADRIAGVERQYRYDEHGRLRDVRTPSTGKKAELRFLERLEYRPRRGNALVWNRQQRAIAKDPLELTRYQYGNGKRSGARAGARDRLVQLTSYAGMTPKSRLVSETSHSYLTNGQLGASHSTTYSKQARRVTKRVAGRRVQRTVKMNRANTRQVEVFHLDVRGRRHGVSSSFQNVASGLGIQRDAVRYEYELDAVDPLVEISTRDDDPSVRVVMRSHAGGILGEIRDGKARYQLQDQRGSVRSVINGAAAPSIQATFDYDTWGKPATHTKVASGPAKQRQQQALGFTGMRTNQIGNITHHHARDYDANNRTWLTTDQYQDPWQDVALSFDPRNRMRGQYVSANPIGATDPDGHRFRQHIDGGGMREYMPAGDGSIMRRESGAGTCKCTTTTSRTGTMTVSTSSRTRTYTGSMKNAQKIVSKLRIAMVDHAEYNRLQRISESQSLIPVNDFDYIGLVGAAVKGIGKFAVRKSMTRFTRGAAAAAAEKAAANTASRSSRHMDIVVEKAFCSFSARTRVLMADGVSKPISQIKVGDYVMSASEAAGRDPRPRRVNRVWKHRDRLMQIKTTAGIIETTSDHPFFSAASESYIPARETVNKELLTLAGQLVMVWSHGPEIISGPAYNLTVDDRHTYFIGVGEAHVLVHNTKGCGTDGPDWGELARQQAQRGQRGGHSKPARDALDEGIDLTKPKQPRYDDPDNPWTWKPGGDNPFGGTF